MKKLLVFLMIAIPLVIILVVNFTVKTVSGFVSVPVDSIVLNQDVIKSIIGEKVTLEATIYPKNASDKEILWTSTDEEVATVDSNGNISFVGFGSGYIVATTNDGNKKASCYFYITDTKVHEVDLFSSTEEEKENYYVAIGEGIQLESVIYPVEAENKEIVYSSENEKIATVDANGWVTGVSEGRVKIVSTSVENNLINDFMIIEVVKPLESLIVGKEKIITSNKSYQINYNVEPTDATVKSVEYESSDEEIATVNSHGLVTFKKQGEVEITLKSLQGGLTEKVDILYTAGYAYNLFIDEEQINKKIDDGEYLINYSTYPANIDTDVIFTSDDDSIVYVDDSGYVQFLKGGKTTIRVKVKKNEKEYIEKTISVFIESPATDIEIEDTYYISTRTIKLNPKSIPETSTNEKFYYVLKNKEIATVTEQGEITFVKNESCELGVDIYANEENSNVKKTVKIIYTNGLPTKLFLNNKNIEIECGVSKDIEAILYPSDLKNKNIKYEIVNQSPNSGSGDVITLSQNGVVEGIAGGEARIKISCKNYLGGEISDFCDVTIIKKTQGVSFNTDIEFYENDGCYVTSKNIVEFELENKTKDASNREIVWELNSDYAIKKSNNSIYFNNSGIAEIIYSSKDGGVNGSVKIQYYKSKLISADLEKSIDEMNVGDEFEFNIINQIPSDSTIIPYIKISNQETESPDGKVLEVNGNKITAIAGGNATITIVIANLKFVNNVRIIRKAESIVIEPKNITTTNDFVQLKTTVLPQDTTNKNIEYLVEDENIATISDGKIVFKKNGIAKITAKTNDGSDIEETFTIEKIEKGTEIVNFDGKTINKELNIGDSIAVVADSKYQTVSFEIKSQNPTIKDNDVVSLEGNTIKAIGSGSAIIVCKTTDYEETEKETNIEISVIKLSEEIKFISTLDYDDENEYYITAKDNIDLNFVVLPETTTNKKYNIAVSDDGIGYIENNKLLFKKAGIITLEATTSDRSKITKQIRIKYTGGLANDAILNFTDNITLNIGEEIVVKVEKWIPSDTLNQDVSISVSSQIVSIEDNKIVALTGGKCDVVVTLSNSVVKTFKITVLNKVTNINLTETKIITAEKEVIINPVVLPSNATNKVLKYTVDNTEIATIENKKVNFKKAGTVIVKIEATDGSGIENRIEITSTYGYISNFELNISELELNKNSSANIYVKKYTPSNATNKVFCYEVLSSVANDGSENKVVSISNNGIVKGLYGGTAKICVYTLDENNDRITQICDVTVVSEITNLDVSFDKELSINQGVYQIAGSELGCNINVYPSDASSKNVKIISSNENVATIYENKVLFKGAGYVEITFKAGTVSKVYAFYYTKFTLKNIEIDKTGFVNTTLTLNAGEEYKIEIKNYSPIDYNIENIEFTLINKVETKNSKQTSSVINFENGKITALNGGTVTFTLKANSIEIGQFKVVVIKKCSDIEVETEVFVSGTEYVVNAKALPIDTYQTELKYEMIDGQTIANLDTNTGKVTFNNYGSVSVKVISIYDENVYKIIKIERTNKIKKLYFKDQGNTIVTGFSYGLSVAGSPTEASGYTIGYSSSNENIASVSALGVVKAKDKEGKVTIRAYVVGQEDIYVEKEFTIISKISKIDLKQDEVNDSLGIGGYRVWGAYFCLDETGEKLIYTYQMEIQNVSPAGNEGNIEWWILDGRNLVKSNSLALISDTGLITFNTKGNEGELVVVAQAKKGYSINENTPARDTYKFILVNGINVTNYTQLRKYVNAGKSVVLQNDIKAPVENGRLLLKANLYGNGYIMDFANTESYYEKIEIKTDNVLVDNVIIRAANFNDGGNLSDLKDVGKCLLIYPHEDGSPTVGVVIRNSIIENAYICSEVNDSEVTFKGCILKNALSTCIQVTARDYTKTPPVITLQDCILSRALFSAISLDFKDVDENGKIKLLDGYYPKVVMKENVKIYNWVKFSEYNIDFITKYTNAFVSSDTLTNLMIDAFKSQTDVCIVEIDGEKSVYLGAISFSYNIIGVKEKKACGIIEQSGNEIKLKKETIGIEIANLVSASMDFYTLQNQNEIGPNEKFTENEELYKGIRYEFKE